MVCEKGVEPSSPAWRAGIIAVIPLAHIRGSFQTIPHVHWRLLSFSLYWAEYKWLSHISLSVSGSLPQIHPLSAGNFYSLYQTEPFNDLLRSQIFRFDALSSRRKARNPSGLHWRLWGDSNSWPSERQSAVLATELQSHKMRKLLFLVTFVPS